MRAADRHRVAEDDSAIARGPLATEHDHLLELERVVDGGMGRVREKGGKGRVGIPDREQADPIDSRPAEGVTLERLALRWESRKDAVGS